MPDEYKVATVLLDGCVYEVWSNREPTDRDLEKLSFSLSHRNAGDPFLFGPHVRVVMTHSAVTLEVVDKLRAALEQRHAGPGLDAATSRGYADVVKDVDFNAGDAATREVFARYVRDDIIRSFSPEIVAALYPPPVTPKELDESRPLRWTVRGESHDIPAGAWQFSGWDGRRKVRVELSRVPGLAALYPGVSGVLIPAEEVIQDDEPDAPHVVGG